MKEILWQGSELADIFQVSGFDAAVSGISIDSRTTSPGDLFIALSGDPGPRFGGAAPGARDGHDFIEMAVANGASAVLAHRDINPGVPVLRVPDTLEGLWTLGHAARHRMSGKVVAITGSSGKTTLRLWLETVLRSLAPTHASVGSFNNHWGVPLSLARMPATAEYGVFEIGTNHPGEIEPLSKMVAPDVAVLLNVLPAHIGNFENMAALTREKLSIAAGLSSTGTFVVPAALRSQAEPTNCISVGENEAADVLVLAAEPDGSDGSTHLRVSVCGSEVDCVIPFSGEARIQSTLTLLAVLSALGIDLASVLPVLSSLPLPQGRGDRRDAGGVVVIDDSYNANPISMQMALAALAAEKGPGRKIALLGEMQELGKDSARLHQEVCDAIAGIDEVMLFGAGFAACRLNSEHRHIERLSDFDLAEFVGSLQEGDRVLVKGANKVFWQQGFVNSLVSLLAE